MLTAFVVSPLRRWRVGELASDFRRPTLFLADEERDGRTWPGSPLDVPYVKFVDTECEFVARTRVCVDLYANSGNRRRAVERKIDPGERPRSSILDARVRRRALAAIVRLHFPRLQGRNGGAGLARP